MKKRIMAALLLVLCMTAGGCGDTDDSRAEKPKLPSAGKMVTSSSQAQSSEVQEESSEVTTTVTGTLAEESSEQETSVTDDYTRHEQIIDENHSRLTQEPLDDKAVEVSFNFCVYAFRGDIKSMQELCTPEFAAAAELLYDDYFKPCSDISINGYNYHVGDTPLAGINLFNSEYNYNNIAWLRLEPQSDGSYLVCDLWEDRGREEPQSVMEKLPGGN